MTQTITQNRGTLRRQAILEHGVRYRMTVPAALRREPALRGMSPKQSKRLLRQLCRDGLLAEAPLYHNYSYYFLPAPNGDDRDRGPLSELAKIRAYAMLAFCCLGAVRRKRLTAEEIQTYASDLYRPGMPGTYYLAAGDPPKFGLALIDAGGRGRWDRVLARVRHQLHEHASRPLIQTLIQQQQFEITILTVLPQKSERLARTLAEWRDPRTNLIRICALPELIHLIAPPPRAGR